MIKKNLICGILLVSIMASFTACGRKEEVAQNDGIAYVETYPETFGTVLYEPSESMKAISDTAAEEVYYDNSYEKTSACVAGDYEDIYMNTEEYSPIKESSFLSSITTPLSTFAADVDTASYSNFRRFVNAGYNLFNFPAGSIRTEEMLNYFTYNYEEPKGGEPFGVQAMVSECPWNTSNKLLRIGITTAEMDSREIPDCNVVFLIDVSGSMQDENKLDLIKKVMVPVIEQFDSNDRISIVTYASGVETVLNGVPGNEQRKIRRGFENLEAGGATYGSGGIERAYEIAEGNYIKNGVNRVIICSDGDFNVGLTSQAELEKLISDKKEKGIFLSTLGFGMYNFSDTTMETLADCGNGNYAYIDTEKEAKKVLIDEMTSTFVTVAKDVKFQVEFNPAKVKEYRLVGYENRAMAAEDFRDDTKDGGELGAGHQVTVLYELVTEGTGSGIDLKYQDTSSEYKGQNIDEYCTVSIAYKTPDGDKSEYRTFPVGTKAYTDRPDDDFIFASAVAEVSLAVRDSEYITAFSNEEALRDAVSRCYDVTDRDEYQEEFIELIETMLDR